MGYKYEQARYRAQRCFAWADSTISDQFERLTHRLLVQDVRRARALAWSAWRPANAQADAIQSESSRVDAKRSPASGCSGANSQQSSARFGSEAIGCVTAERALICATTLTHPLAHANPEATSDSTAQRLRGSHKLAVSQTSSKCSQPERASER